MPRKVTGRLERMALDVLLRRIKVGGVKLTDWNGYTQTYGDASEALEVTVTTPAVVRAIFKSPSLAVGEGYTHRRVLIAEDRLDEFFRLVEANKAGLARLKPLASWTRNERNHRTRQRSQISWHYDVGNDYYRLFLDKHELYSCAYYNSPDDTLEQAQEQKIEHILRKLELQPGQRLLDIGCGWGYLAIAAAQEYGVQVLGITLSQEQLAGARQQAERAGVADKVRFELMNYQDLDEPAFDRIVSVGMFEHVGKDNQATYFQAIKRLLKPGGISVLHTITNTRDEPNDAWIDKHIFPGGHLPTVASVTTNILGAGFWPAAQEDLCQHYARTLDEWRRRHTDHEAAIIEMYDEAFYRMRDFWLAGSAAGFRYSGLGLSQFIFTNGKPGPDGEPRTLAHVYR